MRVSSLRLVGIRCFEDTGDVALSSKINLFVGLNNAGKSTFLKGLLALQGFPFGEDDLRAQQESSSVVAVLVDHPRPPQLQHVPSNFNQVSARLVARYRGGQPNFQDNISTIEHGIGNTFFPNTYPNNFIVPFLARRKASAFSEDVSLKTQTQVAGTFTTLNGRIDEVATAGHPRHKQFLKARDEIIGLPITTRKSPNGKQAGMYLDDEGKVFATLDRMGDGITEMAALIVELCLARDKLFVIEEPETDLHPRGLKALLSVVRAASETNQFVISTHSNIVVRELGAESGSKVFRVHRSEAAPASASIVEEVPRTSAAHDAVLRELGYEFYDLGLPDAWLFLEESSAEEIIREILIPFFAPTLRGRLRTFSAGGVSNVEPRLEEFQRLVVFVHLQPAYERRLWVRVDGDEPGKGVVAGLRRRFTYLTDATCATFEEPMFERYYPKHFANEVAAIAPMPAGKSRRDAKAALLRSVMAWTTANLKEAHTQWKESASEQIKLLQAIAATLT